ncbi:SDR family NAD(P)-dependent oxidoreductase [Stenotrophobium rhamnosiphilum]|uniref:Ketoacyl reductase n=1 Tax=Stenotrophobium rhamnosiphilum TaxID=2029166 RepID=A0A2T5MKN4_9GAMM|nr:SDR family oxidoreductase [Stenotrophobium rhamnosiphilum]PTU33119.1 ketoacyl reductase [Stenotrophobium rhamnosiphilum]
MSLPQPSSESRAVITGASSGIGEQLARQLAERGHSLILVARRIAKLEALAAELRDSYKVTVDLRPCDLADRKARKQFRDELAAADISILCNNAGFATFGKLANLDAEREREELELNAVAVQDLTLAVLPGMIQRKTGAILIVGSTSGHQPTPANATYAASKAFANSFAEALHSELHGTGVSCTLLAPGPTRTAFTEVAGVSKLDRLGPLWVSASSVAHAGIDGMARNKRIVIPGFVAQAQTVGGRYTPRSILLPVLKQVFSRLA